MTAAESVLGKYRALKGAASRASLRGSTTGTTIVAMLSYSRGAELPPLRLQAWLHRASHRPEDQVLLQFYEVFHDKTIVATSPSHRCRTIVVLSWGQHRRP